MSSFCQSIVANPVVVLAATVLLSALPTYRGLKVVESPMLMRMEIDDAVFLKEKPLWNSCDQAWIGMPCNATDSVDEERHADVEPSFQLSRFVGELFGLILATLVLITSESAWRKRGAYEKPLSFLQCPYAYKSITPMTQVETEIINEAEIIDEETQEPEQHQALPTQDELDWISSARSGKRRLTEDVYKAAMQWWLQQPLAALILRITPQDQKLLKPVLDLSQRGQDKKASLLMEQIGRLDKLDREVRRSSCKHLVDSAASLSPLSRSPMNTASKTALMRKGIESYVTPGAHSHCSGEKAPYWHVPQKTNRNQFELGEKPFGVTSHHTSRIPQKTNRTHIKLGEHPFAAVASPQHSSRPLSDSQPLRRASQDSNQSLYEFGCACGA